jgi:hypothetical protein
VKVKAGPPGWEPHKIVSRIDGWVIDPDDEDRIPAPIAELIARAMPQPADDTVAAIRARMWTRQRMHELEIAVLGDGDDD